MEVRKAEERKLRMEGRKEGRKKGPKEGRKGTRKEGKYGKRSKKIISNARTHYLENRM